MTKQEIIEKVNKEVFDLRDMNQDDLLLLENKETRLAEDLGIDSLEKVELVIELEREFAIHISDTEVDSILTLNDIYQYVDKKVNILT